jgi:hypothetical protein
VSTSDHDELIQTLEAIWARESRWVTRRIITIVIVVKLFAIGVICGTVYATRDHIYRTAFALVGLERQIDQNQARIREMQAEIGRLRPKKGVGK